MNICPTHGKKHYPAFVKTPDGHDRIAQNPEHHAQLTGQQVNECGEVIVPPAPEPPAEPVFEKPVRSMKPSKSLQAGEVDPLEV